MQYKNKVSNKGRTERGRKDRAHPLSDDFEVTRETVQKAKELGLTEDEANDELDKFMNYYIEKEEEKTDWNLVLQNWFIRAAQYKAKNAVAKSKAEQPTRSPVREFESDPTIRRGDPEIAHQALGNILSKLKLNGGSPNGLGSAGKGETKGSD